MNEKKLKTAQLKINGMTCGSCELILERKLAKVPGVLKVDVNHRTGIADVVADTDNLPSAEELETAIAEAGYNVEHGTHQSSSQESPHTKGILKVRIDGMSGQNCKLLISEKLKLIEGVQFVSIHYADRTATIHYKGVRPAWEDLYDAVKSAGFTMRHINESAAPHESSHQKWLEIGASLLIIFSLYEILKTFDVISFVSSSTAGATTLGGILLIGLVAGTSSCLAVTGGLLLSVAAKYNEAHQSLGKWAKLKPLLYFNAGRLFSYFLFGGLIGVLGRSITLSPRTNGYLNIFVAFVMFYLALSILKVIPKGKFPIHIPKHVSHWIANLSESERPTAPFSLGMLTFFLPCGFTQSLQLVALASGSFTSGAMTMFIFALGTLPALLGISAISSSAKGKSSRLFLRFSGTLVLVLALFNLNSGLLLAGVNPSTLLPSIRSNVDTVDENGKDQNVTEDADGTQVINLRVTGYGYNPTSFTVVAGKPTIVRAVADNDSGGCASVLTIPAFNVLKYIAPGSTGVLGPFTPKDDFLITCSMGMFYANVKVVKNGSETVTSSYKAPSKPTINTASAAIVDGAQTVDLTWTNAGYSPQILTVKRGAPTTVKLSSTVPTGGCMGTIVFPEFNQSAFVPKPGQAPASVVLDTTNADAGDYAFTCGMGIRMGILRIE
ncbi:sulfite exporter TauE/SafE family protein [Candidatus Peregrinibacteria bacterium]|nr:sulfite exporter TauE/SafE family protein [Candidatus Peregrinibacteria bacterium]